MIEFAAGISVGALFGLVAGLVIAELFPRRAVVEQVASAPQPPAALPAPQPWPYQPPVIVLAGAPRTQVEQRTTALARGGYPRAEG